MMKNNFKEIFSNRLGFVHYDKVKEQNLNKTINNKQQTLLQYLVDKRYMFEGMDNQQSLQAYVELAEKSNVDYRDNNGCSLFDYIVDNKALNSKFTKPLLLKFFSYHKDTIINDGKPKHIEKIFDVLDYSCMEGESKTTLFTSYELSLIVQKMVSYKNNSQENFSYLPLQELIKRDMFSNINKEDICILLNNFIQKAENSDYYKEQMAQLLCLVIQSICHPSSSIINNKIASKIYDVLIFKKNIPGINSYTSLGGSVMFECIMSCADANLTEGKVDEVLKQVFWWGANPNQSINKNNNADNAYKFAKTFSISSLSNRKQKLEEQLKKCYLEVQKEKLEKFNNTNKKKQKNLIL